MMYISLDSVVAGHLAHYPHLTLLNPNKLYIFQAINPIVPKKKYHLTLHEKLEIVRFLEKNPRMSMRQISNAVGANLNRTISKTAISDIIKKREDILNNATENLNRVRLKSTRPKVDKKTLLVIKLPNFPTPPAPIGAPTTSAEPKLRF